MNVTLKSFKGFLFTVKTDSAKHDLYSHMHVTGISSIRHTTSNNWRVGYNEWMFVLMCEAYEWCAAALTHNLISHYNCHLKSQLKPCLVLSLAHFITSSMSCWWVGPWIHLTVFKNRMWRGLFRSISGVKECTGTMVEATHLTSSSSFSLYPSDILLCGLFCA